MLPHVLSRSLTFGLLQVVTNKDALLDKRILKKIFKFFSAEDVLKASLVCKNWNEAAHTQSIWRKFLSSFFASSKVIPEKSEFKGQVSENCFKNTYSLTTVLCSQWKKLVDPKRKMSIKRWAKPSNDPEKEEKEEPHFVDVPPKRITFQIVRKLKKSIDFNFIELVITKDDNKEFRFGAVDSKGAEYSKKLKPGTFKKFDKLILLFDKKERILTIFHNGKKIKEFLKVVLKDFIPFVKFKKEITNDFKISKKSLSIPFWDIFFPLISRDIPQYVLKQSLDLKQLSYEEIKKVRILGISSFSTAYKGYWTGQGGGIKIAIKEYLYDIPIQIINHEIRLSKELNFPFIRRIYGYARTDRSFLVVNEYLKYSLWQLSKKDIPFSEKFSLIKKSIQAVNFIHFQNIVHKNLKSGVFLCDKGMKTIKLSDFSMVNQKKFFGDRHIRWDAPEVIKGNLFSKKSDVYSLGGCIFEFLTGKIPFHEENDIEKIKKMIVKGERPSLPMSIPQAFRTLINMCWEVKPSHRPSCGELLEFLSNLSSQFKSSKKKEEIKSLNYEIISQIGRGGFGIVYKGLDKDTGKIIAIKKMTGLNKITLNDAQVEIKFLKKLKHKNIIEYIGSEMKGKNFFVFLEFAGDGHIGQFIKKNFKTINSKIKAMQIYLKPILQGLKYLHDKNISHRDIKPQNILVHDGVPKIADFGCAKELLSGGEVLRNTLTGTRPYMPPELIQNKRKFKMEPLKFDIWAMGISISELITSKHLFDLDSFMYDQSGFQLMNYIVNLEKPPEVPEVIGKKCKVLEDLIKSCLEINPAHRATCNELLSHPFFSADLSNLPNEEVEEEKKDKKDKKDDENVKKNDNEDEEEGEDCADDDLDMIKTYVSGVFEEPEKEEEKNNDNDNDIPIENVGGDDDDLADDDLFDVKTYVSGVFDAKGENN